MSSQNTSNHYSIYTFVQLCICLLFFICTHSPLVLVLFFMHLLLLSFIYSYTHPVFIYSLLFIPPSIDCTFIHSFSPCLFMYPVPHSVNQRLLHSFTLYFIGSFILPLEDVLFHSSLHSFICLLFPGSLIYSMVHVVVHPFIHSSFDCERFVHMQCVGCICLV